MQLAVTFSVPMYLGIFTLQQQQQQCAFNKLSMVHNKLHVYQHCVASVGMHFEQNWFVLQCNDFSVQSIRLFYTRKRFSCNAHNARDTYGTSIIIENWLYCYIYMKKGFGPNLSTSGVFNRTSTFSPNQYHMFMCTTGTETTDGYSHWMVWGSQWECWS